MTLEIIQEEINSRALGVALSEPSFDELCYRVAALTIGVERLTDLAQDALLKANWESRFSSETFQLVKSLEPLMAKGKDYGEKQSKIAQNPRKEKPTKEVLLEFKKKWIYDHGIERGWLKAAGRKFGLSQNTIKSLL